jgi:hypothetical protein
MIDTYSSPSRGYPCSIWLFTELRMQKTGSGSRRVGDVWLLVKIVLRPWSWRAMATLRVVTFLKASPSQPASTNSCCSGGNPRSGFPGSDDGGATSSFYLLGHRFWSSCWMLADVGGVVLIYHIVGAKSRWHGYAEYQRQMRDDVCAQVGGAV